MKKVVLKSQNTSVRLSGSVIKFLTPVSPELELTDEEYLEYEGQLLWLMKEGIVDVVDIEKNVQVEQEVVQEEENLEKENKNRRKKQK